MIRLLRENHEGEKDKSMQSQEEGREEKKKREGADVNTRKANRSNSS